MFAAIFIGLWVFLLYQRVPAMALFFSLLVGQILSTEVSGEVYSMIASALSVDFSQVQLGLLLIPVLLTVLFLRHKVPSSKFLIEAIPMIFVVAALAIFAYPHVHQIQDVLEETTDHKVESYKNVIITIASLSSLFSAWFSYPQGGLRKRSRRHKD